MPCLHPAVYGILEASMKAPPKRRVNFHDSTGGGSSQCLNESPSKKEGKWVTTTTNPADTPVPQ